MSRKSARQRATEETWGCLCTCGGIEELGTFEAVERRPGQPECNEQKPQTMKPEIK